MTVLNQKYPKLMKEKVDSNLHYCTSWMAFLYIEFRNISDYIIYRMRK